MVAVELSGEVGEWFGRVGSVEAVGACVEPGAYVGEFVVGPGDGGGPGLAVLGGG